MITFYGPWLSEEVTLLREALLSQTQVAPGVDWMCLCHPLKDDIRRFIVISCQPIPHVYTSDSLEQLILEIAAT